MGCCPLRSSDKLVPLTGCNEGKSSETNMISSNLVVVQKQEAKHDSKVIRLFSYGKPVDEKNFTGDHKIMHASLVPNYEKLLKRDLNPDKKQIHTELLNSKGITPNVNEQPPQQDICKDNDALQNFANAQSTLKELSPSDIVIIKNSLTNHFLFKDLSNSIIEQITTHLFLLQLHAGDLLFTEGDKGHFFFIVKSGVFELSIANVDEKKYFRKGDTFGEMALLIKTQRSGTVKCTEDAEVFFLDGNIFREFVHSLNTNDIKERIYFLKLCPLFAGLDAVEIGNVAHHLLKCEYSKGYQIIKEGEKGESLFMVKEGLVSCTKLGKEIRTLYSKDYFGETAILFDTKRALTITSYTNSVCYQLSTASLLSALGENYKDVLLMSLCKDAFKKSQFLKYLMVGDIFQKMFPKFQLRQYTEGQEVYTEDNAMTSKKVVIVIEGNLLNSTSREKLAGKGDIVGESFLTNSAYMLSSVIISSTDCITVEAYWKDLISTIDIQIPEKKIVGFFSKLSHLRKIQIFKHLSEARLMEILNMMKKKKFVKDEVIIEEGSEGNFLYFLYKGKVKVYKNEKLLREYQDYTCFGEISLLLDQPHTATVISGSTVSTYVLSKDSFKYCIDQQMFNFLIKKISLMDHFSTKLDDLYYISTLGEGKFGHVSLVHNTKNLYAIKAVHRQSAERKKILIRYFLKEREILLTIDYPFIIKLVKTLKNDDYIFYLMEYVNGRSLSKYLDNRKKSAFKQKYEAQFYTSSLLLIVNYLNSKQIVHRDLKPDNILLDEKGYLKLIDFNTSMIIHDLTTTVAGSPHYMAPEIILGKGYTFSVDYWSIGVIAYEIYFGYRPFGNEISDPLDIYREIVNKEVEIPCGAKDSSTVQFLKKLLNKRVSKRVCNLDQLRCDVFFANFDWDGLIDFKAEAPYIPEKKIKTEGVFKMLKMKYSEKISKRVNAEYSANSDIDENEIYDPNWANEF